MPRPRLTFFCELDCASLQELFSSPRLIEDLKSLQAKVSMGILDFSDERAKIIRQLNENGIAIIAWLLLPEEQGYWFNLDNYPQAHSLYRSFREWTRHQGLVWDAIGIDIEPDIRETKRLFRNKWALAPLWIKRTFDRKTLKHAQFNYNALVEQMHTDGYVVECYQFPVIIDERMLKSTFMQRVLRVVDIPSDREVLMLYSHFFRPLGMGMLWSYAPQAQAIAVGSTGGGVDGELAQFHPLSYQELERDLRLAWHWCDDLYIYSLEGCLQQGFLEQLKAFEWDRPMLPPIEATQTVNRLRCVLQYWLWITAHPTWIVASLGAFLFLVAQLRHNTQQRGRYGKG